MGSCLSSFSQKKERAAESQSVQDESDEYEEECEEESEDVLYEGGQKPDGWSQYNQWVRKRLLDKWSDEADERRKCGLSPKEEIDEERLVEMIMFGMASKGLKGLV
jgi:hypothetical protein